MATGSEPQDRDERTSTSREEWSWQPAMGEGSATALDKLHRAERVKRTWRELKPPPPADEEASPSA